MLQRDIDGAIADYTKAIELKPDYADAYFDRAGLKRDEKGDLNGALADYNRAVELAPNNPAIKQARDETQARATGATPSQGSLKEAMALDAKGQMKLAKQDLDGAMADFNQAVATYPAFAQAYRDRGKIKASKHDFDGALADFTKAIAVQPDDALAYFNRGCLKRDEKGDLHGALADFNHAVGIRPNSPVFKKARDETQQKLQL